MAFRDFHDKAEKDYMENKDEAWEEIKEFFSSPTTWIVAGIALLLIVAGIFTVKFLGAVRAPSIPGENGATTVDGQTLDPTTGETEIPIDEIDESNTEQPLISGARKEDYYTFLLFGTDKEGTNTDTIMVVSYDVKNQKLNLMSIPRDTMVNVSWDIKKINSVYGMSGINGLKKHIGKLIGFTPDYYVKIDLKAFVEVVDLIGGVEFDVPISMHYHDPYQDLNIDLEPGVQLLNGEQAMGLVRFRKSDRMANGKMTGYDDTGRIQTQQAFLKAMFKQCLQIKNWNKITGYVEIFERNVESDLTLGNMLWFARQAMELSEDGFSTCTIPGNYYASAWSRSTNSMQSYVTLYAQQIVKLVNENFNPYLAQVTTANLDIMSINSDGTISSSTGYVADSRATAPPDIDGEDAQAEDEDGNGEEPENGEDGSEPTQGGQSGNAGTSGGSGTGSGTDGTAGSSTAPETGIDGDPDAQASQEEPAAPQEVEPTDGLPAEEPVDETPVMPSETSDTTPDNGG